MPKPKRKNGSTSKPRASRRPTQSALPAAVPAEAAASPVLPPAAPAPQQADIAARAHAIWIERGSPVPGSPLDDWLAAEHALAAKR